MSTQIIVTLEGQCICMNSHCQYYVVGPIEKVHNSDRKRTTQAYIDFSMEISVFRILDFKNINLYVCCYFVVMRTQGEQYRRRWTDVVNILTKPIFQARIQMHEKHSKLGFENVAPEEPEYKTNLLDKCVYYLFIVDF